MARILCIIRTSTVQQELVSQHNDMESFCVGLGFSVGDIEWLEVSGASARKQNEQYLQLLDSVKSTILRNPEIKNVGLWHLNRLGRREIRLIEMKTWFIAHGIQVYVKNPSLTLLNGDGTVNNMASMFWNMLSVSIEVDTEELINKTKRGRQHNREIGKFNGGAYGTLFGYRVNPNGFIEPDEMEVQLLLQVFSDYATGKYSYRSLASEYQSRGIKQRNRKITENWIARTLQCDKYVGTEPAKFKQIIPSELWERTRTTASGNSLNLSKETHIHMATKILKCKYCGHNYIATRNQYTCYAHVKHNRFDKPCKESCNISMEIMDRILIDTAKIYHLEYVSKVDTDALSDEEGRLTVINEKISTIEGSMEQIKKSISRVREIFIDGEITRQEYNSKVQALKARQKTLNEARGALYIDAQQTAIRIDGIRNPNPDSFIRLFLDIDDEKNRVKLREIVLQHIKEATIEKCIFMERKCIKINVTPYNGSDNVFYYFYTIKDSSRQLYRQCRDGVVPCDSRDRLQ